MTGRSTREARDREARDRAARERQPGGEEPAMILEPGQLVTGRQRPVPRAILSRGASTALWALRIFVIVVGVMVIYTFFAQLGA